jgi:hypothetical protein
MTTILNIYTHRITPFLRENLLCLWIFIIEKNCTVWLKTNLKILMLDTWCNEVFLSDQLCQHGLSFQCFGGFLSLSSRTDALRDAALHCVCAYCWLLWTNVLVQEWTSIKTVPSVNCNGCLLTALLQFKTIFLVPWISN